jgi:type IV fimbrial biogenesis protein FimT
MQVPPRSPIFALNRRQLGFTAIELMVVVAIVAILAALAAPSFRDLTDGFRVRAATEELTNTLYFARAEAIKRGGLISVSKNCSTGTTQEWNCGWIIFTDANNDGTVNGTDAVLQTVPTMQNIDVVYIGGGAFYRVDRWGQINGLGAVGFAITPTSTGSASPHATALCLSSGGRAKATKGSVTCP